MKRDIRLLLNILLLTACTLFQSALHSMEFIKKIIGGSSTNAQALFNAIENNDLALLEELLKQENTDINQKDYYGETLLYAAVKGGKINIVKSLLAHKADPNLQRKRSIWQQASYDGDTVLHLLASDEFAHGVDCSIEPLPQSVFLQMAFKWLESIFNPECNPYYSQSDKVKIWMKYDILQALLSSGINLCIKNDYSETFLHRACDEGNSTVILAFIATIQDCLLNLPNLSFPEMLRCIFDLSERQRVEKQALLLLCCRKHSQEIKSYLVALPKPLVMYIIKMLFMRAVYVGMQHSLKEIRTIKNKKNKSITDYFEQNVREVDSIWVASLKELFLLINKLPEECWIGMSKEQQIEAKKESELRMADQRQKTLQLIVDRFKEQKMSFEQILAMLTEEAQIIVEQLFQEQNQHDDKEVLEDLEPDNNNVSTEDSEDDD